MRRRSCECGVCKVCKNREVSRRYYQNHKEEVIPKNKKYREDRKGRDYELRGSKELDEKAMEWLKFWGFRG